MPTARERLGQIIIAEIRSEKLAVAECSNCDTGSCGITWSPRAAEFLGALGEILPRKLKELEAEEKKKAQAADDQAKADASAKDKAEKARKKDAEKVQAEATKKEATEPGK